MSRHWQEDNIRIVWILVLCKLISGRRSRCSLSPSTRDKCRGNEEEDGISHSFRL